MSGIQEQVFNKIKLTPIERVNYKLMRKDKDFTKEDIDAIVKLMKQDRLDFHRFKDFPKDIIEKAILKSKKSRYVYWYIIEILESRWIEAEPFIMKDPGCAHHYAKDILKSRWKEAEQYIKQNEYYWNKYKKRFKIYV